MKIILVSTPGFLYPEDEDVGNFYAVRAKHFSKEEIKDRTLEELIADSHPDAGIVWIHEILHMENGGKIIRYAFENEPI